MLLSDLTATKNPDRVDFGSPGQMQLADSFLMNLTLENAWDEEEQGFPFQRGDDHLSPISEIIENLSGELRASMFAETEAITSDFCWGVEWLPAGDQVMEETDGQWQVLGMQFQVHFQFSYRFITIPEDEVATTPAAICSSFATILYRLAEARLTRGVFQSATGIFD